MPVAQRATIKLAQELRVMDGENDKADAAAAAITARLKTPMDEVDIDGIAILTRIDKDTVHRAAAKACAAHAAAAH